ncbi:PqiC family protein [Pseudoduganella violaceinigra]|uniref:PqiC family protein n=1 Tax=Pseudoduganella violaceinigra TaxID=246602 RepID=UPI0003F5AE34|nr:PqiC family protein [Pseudoduganella violaceinigra]
MMRWHVLSGGIVAALSLAGCASAPPEHFYSLSNGMASAASTPNPGYYIEVQNVSVPQQVARSQLVVTSAEGRIDVMEQERWASPPASEIGQALSLAVSGELGVIDVFRTQPPEKSAVYRISTNVQRFESAPGKYAMLDAVWSIRLAGSAQVLTCRTTAREEVAPGYDELVMGHRRAVAKVASDIAKALRSQVAGKGVCP